MLLKHGKVVSHHASEAKAKAAIRAIYANTNENSQPVIRPMRRTL